MQKSPHMTLVLGLAAAGMALAASPLAAREHLTGEQQLAKMLEGRVAGKPVDCISLNTTRSSTVIDKTAIVYEEGSTLYVNRPTNADSLDSDDILVTKTSLSQLCRLDTVHLHDRSMFSWNGFVGLEQFVPYKRVAAK